MREKLIEVLSRYNSPPPCDTCKTPIGHCDMCGIDRLADYLISSGVTIQQWIPVTERLPEEDVRVLVWLGTGDITYTQIDTDRLHKKKWRRWTKNVTHWMPLPEPPAIDK